MMPPQKSQHRKNTLTYLALTSSP
jgi:hypothetical protein